MAAKVPLLLRQCEDFGFSTQTLPMSSLVGYRDTTVSAMSLLRLRAAVCMRVRAHVCVLTKPYTFIHKPCLSRSPSPRQLRPGLYIKGDHFWYLLCAKHDIHTLMFTRPCVAAGITFPLDRRRKWDPWHHCQALPVLLGAGKT